MSNPLTREARIAALRKWLDYSKPGREDWLSDEAFEDAQRVYSAAESALLSDAPAERAEPMLTHLIVGGGRLACGNTTSESKMSTHDPRRVDCDDCLKSTAAGEGPRAEVALEHDYAPYWLVALRACDEALNHHKDWCGYRAGSPGHTSFNRAERCIRIAFRRADFEAKTGANLLQNDAAPRVPDPTLAEVAQDESSGAEEAMRASDQCRIGESMADEYFQHAAECPACEAYEAARVASIRDAALAAPREPGSYTLLLAQEEKALADEEFRIVAARYGALVALVREWQEARRGKSADRSTLEALRKADRLSDAERALLTVALPEQPAHFEPWCPCYRSIGHMLACSCACHKTAQSVTPSAHPGERRSED